MPQTRPCESQCLTLNCHKRYLLNLGAGRNLTLSVSDWQVQVFSFFLKRICCASATVWLGAATKEINRIIHPELFISAQRQTFSVLVTQQTHITRDSL